MPNITPGNIFDRLTNLVPPDVHSSLLQYRGRACAQQYRLPFECTQRYVPTPAHILDWGCGNGHFSFFLHEAGHHVDGYAFGAPAPMISYLQRQVDRPLVYSAGSETDPVKLPYADSHFDAVFSIGVLEHVREVGGDELESLREIGRVLRPNGLFLCFHFPNRLSWIEALTTVFRSRFHHRYKYTKKDIFRLAHEAGFQVLEVRRYNAFPRNVFSSIPFGRRSRWLAGGVDALDSALTWVLNPLCQNYACVLRRKA